MNHEQNTGAVKPPYESNAPYLEATKARICDVIIEYCSERVGKQFHADDLRRYVTANVIGGCAPGSADRVLRDLRQQGTIIYEVMNRRESLYLIERVNRPVDAKKQTNH